ncbi:hypothetical protein CORC01_04605 [Colletotrichum orchidophilum]|uniref:VOC domain-containing protein n=1 Tax=Colletotrichum orchidophilum TaxID=1209926 RepID=A0A1G4BFV2_9PEZI|nr:uncharacterized protein CORC01_04605 [Colletotrichum orchidophilum]OHF00197.1 hypothetical protein CORC01_04605 [Colletotrichum orchidophilum]
MTFNPLPEIRNDSSKVQLDRISHVFFDHPDLNKFHTFAIDFGLTPVETSNEDLRLYRGYGKDPYCYVARRSKTGKPAFGGGAFLAQTEAEFDKAAAIESAVISDLSGLPGGGRMITLKSPAGFPFHVVHGIEDRQGEGPVPSAQVESLGPLNGSVNKNRKFQRFHPGPALVHKLGHYGFIVSEWEKEVDWYTRNFNFVPSDVQYAPQNENMDVVTFMHLDLGERYSDHHSLFVSRATPGEGDRMHHASFEVEDFDTQLLGHEWLAGKNYTSVWGVGRHILGSQIFDYWRDPTGFTIEHYADGDLVNVHTGTKRSMAGALHVWGPEMTDEMMKDGTSPTAA